MPSAHRMFRTVIELKKHLTISERLALPTETFSDTPLVELRGKRSVCIENHAGILEYTSQCIRVAVKCGSVHIIGAELVISRMTRKRLEVRGSIRMLELE